jgi:histone-lysine N-methyltransferase SETMAR
LESARVPFDQGSRKGRKFNTGYYIAEILEPLSQWRSIEAAENERKLLVHADRARSHTAKLSTQYFNENRMKLAPHPPYSPDLAPSDFYLFGDVKRCLAGLSFKDLDQLLAAVEDVLEHIESDFASGLSRVDGPIKEMYRCQWEVY